MNTFKKKSLYAALVGASALGMAGGAQAVNLNPQGLGEVLIYPYYTIQDKVPGAAFASLLSIVNSTVSAKAVKVRFLEGRASQEVLDFNLFLSPRDVWTAAVLPVGVGAGIATLDVSCTLPVVPGPAAPQPFRNSLYEGDLAGDGLERTKEGYVEVIEMGRVSNTALARSVTHDPAKGQVPPCTGLTTVSNSDFVAPNGGLFGGMTLINVLAGEDYTEDAVALEQFHDNAPLYSDPGSIFPNLADVFPPVSVVVASGGFNTQVIQSAWFNSIDAISAVFMHDNIFNEYVLDAGTKSGTDWIVTMPTKRYYYDDSDCFTAGQCGSGDFSRVLNDGLFQRNFGAGGACDDIRLTLWDREERSVTNVDFSPSAGGPRLCWEANVITFNGTNVFGSKNVRNIVTSFQNGWAALQFPSIGSTVHRLFSPVSQELTLNGVSGTASATYFGLPVVGFAAISFTNGTLTDNAGRLVQSQYGGTFVHKTTEVPCFGCAPVGVAQ